MFRLCLEFNNKMSEVFNWYSDVKHATKALNTPMCLTDVFRRLGIFTVHTYIYFSKITHGGIALMQGSLGNIRLSHKPVIAFPFMQMQIVADVQYIWRILPMIPALLCFPVHGPPL